MSSFWNFLFGAILVVVWVIAGGFVTRANVLLHPYKDMDADLNQAHTYTFWAAFVTWFLVGVFIILVLLSVLGVIALFGSGAGEEGVAAEEAEGTEAKRAAKKETKPQKPVKEEEGISWFTIGFLVFALILVGITGILSALAASAIVRSPNYNSGTGTTQLQTAHSDCIIAASLSLGAGGLLIIGIIIYYIIGEHRKRQEEAAKLAQHQQITT